MSLFGPLRKLLGFPRATPYKRSAGAGPAASGGLSKEEAGRLLAAMESGELRIPADVHDAQGWDRYWSAQLKYGGLEQGFNDMMASDAQLLDTLIARSARTVLCVGNGLSSESYALAFHGFEVTVLDLSEVPRALMASIIRDPQHPFQSVPGFTIINEAQIRFEKGAPIDPGSIPPMHKSDAHPPIGGGGLSYVTGDLSDEAACPGPFDAVIERRTVQLFPRPEQALALDRLAARLGRKGLLVSHQHHGGWRPGEPRHHFALDWIQEHGFVTHFQSRTADRVAWLWYTTG